MPHLSTGILWDQEAKSRTGRQIYLKYHFSQSPGNIASAFGCVLLQEEEIFNKRMQITIMSWKEHSRVSKL